jgi:hypothetical protein
VRCLVHDIDVKEFKKKHPRPSQSLQLAKTRMFNNTEPVIASSAIAGGFSTGVAVVYCCWVALSILAQLQSSQHKPSGISAIDRAHPMDCGGAE